MATLKDRFAHWKKSRSGWKKAGDIFFWVLLVLLILPGPRKVISTAVNRIVLLVRNPSMPGSSSRIQLQPDDYQWMLKDAGGGIISMDRFTGQVVFLNFWATWCPPCVAELPEIQRAYDRYGDRVAFVLVTGEEPERVRRFFEKHGYRLPVYYQAGPVPEVLAHNSIPTTFILSRDGKLVLKKTGAANWDSGATSRMFEKLIR
ncbi:MAG TPA: TlpA family protein disulfide reductase [Bacteroides sp.]|nr:TlpA family protein disulfide reductase [Bacteroides sp.]